MREVHWGARKDGATADGDTKRGADYLFQYFTTRTHMKRGRFFIEDILALTVVVQDGRRVKSDGFRSISPILIWGDQGIAGGRTLHG